MKSTDDRSTPIKFFKPLDDEFHFDVDVCANERNHKCERYFSQEQNGLREKWAPMRCWMNPPYSEIEVWLIKTRMEVMDGALVVALLPTDSSTKWFHKYIWDNKLHKFRQEVRYPDKRLKFDNDNSAKFASMIVIFR